MRPRRLPVASLSARRREPEPARFLPYALHVSDSVLALDSGALMTCFRLTGASFETADIRDLNDRHVRLNASWRNLASDRLAVWHHLVRRQQTAWPDGDFQSAFAQELDAAYRGRMAAGRLYANDLFVTLVLHPGVDPAERTQAWVQRLIGRGVPAVDDADVSRLEEIAEDLAQHLRRYEPTRLGLRHLDGLVFSEPLEMLRLILTGRPEAVPLTRGHLGAALYASRLIFGREAIEIRDAAETRYAGMLGLKEYPAATRPGHWDTLLSAPFPFVLSQSFAFLSKPAAQAVMSRKQNQMVSTRDRAASQIAGLDEALDDLTSNRFALGEHQASLLVLGDTARALADHMSRASALLAESGLVVVREDLGLEAGFWAQFPGNFRYRLRPAAITSRNFAGLAPFHTHPAGRGHGNHWGEAVALLRTTAGSPYHFNFHAGDLGHTFICGPSGSGKTVVQNFMLGQLEKLGCQQVFIDKDRGAEIFIRACGGTYLTLRPGEPTGFAPLKAAADTPPDRAFLRALIRSLVAGADGALGVEDENAIERAVAAVLKLPADERSFAALRSLLGQREAGGIGARLDRWRQGRALGWALDGETDALDLSPRLAGFDMTHLLDSAEVRTPLMLYLFHRLQKLVDGRRLVIDIDEFWKALGDEAFRGLAEDGLKTFRKQNAFMVFGTQSPADVLRSPIAHTIVEQCATKIFLPNPHASERDYVDGFGLTCREFQLIRDELSAEQRRFLVKQGLDSVVVELDLGGLEDALAVLSGRAETVDLLDRIRGIHGDDPTAWLAPFQQARREAR
ncbi:type IV secretory pathway, VirB4 component [Phenylobacterium zucineum HLK1]|uniref:Type IV secretion system protein virB4 n=1 Tax=Phenylobacterium zucineum (strain HLK1) TaxID=450851 RepID=B4RFU7_PHEZH|nr:type IV secretory pathway, VirB4 component [Phenylobacterium zucineum HLK1]